MEQQQQQQQQWLKQQQQHQGWQQQQKHGNGSRSVARDQEKTSQNKRRTTLADHLTNDSAEKYQEAADGWQEQTQKLQVID